jgi:hypothetical protein
VLNKKKGIVEGTAFVLKCEMEGEGKVKRV